MYVGQLTYKKYMFPQLRMESDVHTVDSRQVTMEMLTAQSHSMS